MNIHLGSLLSIFLPQKEQLLRGNVLKRSPRIILISTNRHGLLVWRNPPRSSVRQPIRLDAEESFVSPDERFILNRTVIWEAFVRTFAQRAMMRHLLYTWHRRIITDHALSIIREHLRIWVRKKVEEYYAPGGKLAPLGFTQTF